MTVEVSKACADLIAIAEGEGVNAGVDDQIIGQKAHIGLVDHALRLLGQKADKIVANLGVIVPHPIGHGR